MNVPAGTVSSEQSATSEKTESAVTTPEVQSETKTSEEKPADGVKPLIEGEKTEAVIEEFVPLTAADIIIPEGLEISDTRRDEALAIINNRELSPKDQLQALVNLQGELAKEASEGISKTWEDTQKTWQDEVKADPTIGGDKLPTTLAAVNKLVAEYGSDELVKTFALTGAGNNVHVIKFLHSIASKLLEGGPVPATSPGTREGDAASRMFPSMKG